LKTSHLRELAAELDDRVFGRRAHDRPVTADRLSDAVADGRVSKSALELCG
jgi:hypothetical protein